MNYNETYVIEYLNADREWVTADEFDSEEDAVVAFKTKSARAQHRTFRVRRVMSVTIALCSRGS